MGNSGQSNGGSRIMEIIIAIIIIVALIFLFKYIGRGIAWAFGKYVELLRVK